MPKTIYITWINFFIYKCQINFIYNFYEVELKSSFDGILYKINKSEIEIHLGDFYLEISTFSFVITW